MLIWCLACVGNDVLEDGQVIVTFCIGHIDGCLLPTRETLGIVVVQARHVTYDHTTNQRDDLLGIHDELI